MFSDVIRWRAALAAAAVALGLSAEAGAQTTLSAAQAKAGFVLNFARYVEWPATAFKSADAAVVVCLLGQDGLGEALKAFEGRTVQGRPMSVRTDVPRTELAACHVVFIAESEGRRIAPTLRGLAGQPVLTVSDSERFIDAGGAIGLIYSDDRLQFELNRQAFDQARLKPGASLLRLARIVI